MTIAVRDNIALVSLSYRNVGNKQIVLEQYPTHVHKGTDGIGGVTIYPTTAKDIITSGYCVDNPVEGVPLGVIN